MATPGRQMIVIGVAGLGFESLEIALRQGKLPSLAGIASRGSKSRLKCLVPPESIAAWGCLATGAQPEYHGQLSDAECWAGGARPATRASWRTRPIWQHLSEHGVSSASLCWPGTRPGQTWPGVHVDDRLVEASGVGWADWPFPLDVAPHGLRQLLRESRVHPREIVPELLSPLIEPAALETFRSNPARVWELSCIVARVATLQAAAKIVADCDNDVFFVYHDICARLAKTLADGDPDKLPAAAWNLLDQSLAQITRVKATSVLVLSPGTVGQSGFIVELGVVSGGRAERKPKSILDVAPRILAHFGLVEHQKNLQLLRSSYDPEKDPKYDSGSKVESDREKIDRRSVEEAEYAIPTRTDFIIVQRLLIEAELVIGRDPTHALTLAQRAADIDPASVPALGICASASVRLNESVTLLEVADRIRALCPDHPWVPLIRGTYYAMCGEPTLAYPLLKLAERGCGSDDLMRLAAAWTMAGYRQEAARLFSMVLSNEPVRVAAITGLLSTGVIDQASIDRLLLRILSIDPTRSDVISRLVERLINRGGTKTIGINN